MNIIEKLKLSSKDEKELEKYFLEKNGVTKDYLTWRKWEQIARDYFKENGYYIQQIDWVVTNQLTKKTFAVEVKARTNLYKYNNESFVGLDKAQYKRREMLKKNTSLDTLFFVIDFETKKVHVQSLENIKFKEAFNQKEKNFKLVNINNFKEDKSKKTKSIILKHII